MERLMTTDEVAEILRIDVVTVRRLIARGELAAYRIAGEYRFTVKGVEDFIESQRVVLSPATTIQLGKFTNRGRKVFDLANEEARRRHHRSVGPEHILLAVLRIEDGVGARALSDLQVQLAEVQERIEELHPAEDQPLPEGTLGLDSQSKDMVELAVQEARGLDHHYLGTEHFVLALLLQEESVAGRTLLQLGVTYERARERLLQLLTDERAANWPEQA